MIKMLLEDITKIIKGHFHTVGCGTCNLNKQETFKCETYCTNYRSTGNYYCVSDDYAKAVATQIIQTIKEDEHK